MSKMSERHAKLQPEYPHFHDQFAIAALPAIIAIVGMSHKDDAAFAAYEFADAMMEARKIYEEDNGTEKP
jgi:hypothetical protein